MSWLETWGTAIHLAITLTCTIYLNFVADQVHPLMETVFFKKDITHPATVQKWFKEHNKEFEVLTWPSYSADLNPIKTLCNVF